MTETQPPPETAAAKSRFRSVAYPSSTIEHCKGLTERIHKIFSSVTFTKRESLSKELSISDSHLQTQLSSCVQYGLLELRPGEGYKPTDLFRRVYKPAPTENIQTAYIECFQNPELYKGIIERFEGKDLPQAGGLAALLYKDFKVSDQASEVAAKVFIENAIFTKCLLEDGVLSLGLDQSAVTALAFEEVREEAKPPQLGTIILKPKEEESKEVKLPILLDSGDIIEIKLPNGLKKDDLERIRKVIDLYV